MKIVLIILINVFTFCALTEGFQPLRYLQRRLGLTYKKPNEECLMKTYERIIHHGYPCETHKVMTDDNYILTIYRIPFAKSGASGREPVILQHGFICSSNDWLVLSNNSLPFLLADLGYDVWLANCRGNGVSFEHKTMNMNRKAFWKFSYHEIGFYDLPAVINYALKNSDRPQTQVSLIGHSMGGAAIFIALDSHPDLNSKVRKVIALSPAVYLSNMKSPIVSLLAWIPTRVAQGFLDNVSRGRFLPDFLVSMMHKFLPYLCSAPFTRTICDATFYMAVGYNPVPYPEDTICMASNQLPSHMSSRTFVHFMQQIFPAWQNKVSNLGCGDPKNTYIESRFQQYDYGCEGNYLRYNSSTPPKYNLTNVQAETMVVWSDNDWLVHPDDIKRTVNELGNVNHNYSGAVKDKLYNHMDFFYHPTAKEHVYDHCIRFLSS